LLTLETIDHSCYTRIYHGPLKPFEFIEFSKSVVLRVIVIMIIEIIRALFN